MIAGARVAAAGCPALRGLHRSWPATAMAATSLLGVGPFGWPFPAGGTPGATFAAALAASSIQVYDPGAVRSP